MIHELHPEDDDPHGECRHEIQRLEREVERLQLIEEEERSAAEAKESARLEALKPDRAKLEAVADAVEAITVPEMPDTLGMVRISIQMILDSAAEDIRATIDQM